MSETSIPSGAPAWHASLEKAIQEQEVLLSLLEGTASAHGGLSEVVRELPAKTQHCVMVPFGSAAFMPGYLVHTNELIVHLGAKTYVARTAPQAAEILERRKETLDEEVEGCRSKIEGLRGRMKTGGTAVMAEDGTIDIREEYSEEVHGRSVSSTTRPHHPHSSAAAQHTMATTSEEKTPAPDDSLDQALLDRMEELERLELTSGPDIDIEKVPETTEAAASSPRHRIMGTTVEGLPPGAKVMCAADRAAVGDDAEDSDDDPDFCDAEDGGSTAAGHSGGKAVTHQAEGADAGSRHEADSAAAPRQGRPPEPLLPRQAVPAAVPVVGQVVERSPVLLEEGEVVANNTTGMADAPHQATEPPAEEQPKRVSRFKERRGMS